MCGRAGRCYNYIPQIEELFCEFQTDASRGADYEVDLWHFRLVILGTLEVEMVRFICLDKQI